MRQSGVAVLLLVLALGGCTKTYGPSSADGGSKVAAAPGQAVVVLGFDMMVGGSGINYLTGEALTEYRLAFHRYDAATQQLSDPPAAFYIEQQCAGARSGPACAASSLPGRHGAVAVPPGDYILAFIHSYTPGTYVPVGYGGVTIGAYASLVNAVPVQYTNNVVGSIAAVPGASVAGNPAPRVHLAAGEVVYIGFIELYAARWLREPSAGQPGLAQLTLLVDSRVDAARIAAERGGIDGAKMVERLAAAESQ